MMAIPSFNALITRQTLKNEAHRFELFFKTARQYALLQGTVVMICPSENDQTCSDDWNQPLIAFLNRDESGKPSSSNPIIEHFQTLHPQIHREYSAFPYRNAHLIAPQGLDGSSGNLKISLENQTYSITLNRENEVRVEKE